MKDNSFHNDENWKGSLSDQFDSENIAAPNQAWYQIESELFPKKKRRFAAFWFLIAGLLISGLPLIFLNSGNEKIKNQPILSPEKGTPKEIENSVENKNQQFQNTSNKKPQKVLSENSKFAENNLSNNSKSTKNKKYRVNGTKISTNSS